MTVGRVCDSPKRGVKPIREVCQLGERCDGYGGRFKEVLEGVTVDRKCDSHQRDVKGIRKVCQLMKCCDGRGGDLMGCVNSCQEL